LSFFASLWRSQTRIVAPVMAVSLLFGLIDGLKAASLDHWLPNWLTHLPLAEQGLAWLIPSVATLALVAVIDRLLGKPSEAVA
ncbi:branched-chain amino acid transport system II carrier protein, partial [Pseudomonas aeruginosa]